MGTRRKSRIGLAEADRLAAGGPVASDHAALGALLAAAAAPPFPEELAGERSAVTGFAQAYREATSGVTAAGRGRARLAWSRAAAVKAAVGLAVAVTGGTAFAAANGNLPAGVQRHAHELFSSLGVTAPQNSGHPTGTGTPDAPAPTPTSGVGRSPDPSTAVVLGLCRAWDTERKNPHSKALTPAVRRALAAAAGGEHNIPAFCAALLSGQPGHGSSSATPAPPSGTATPGQSHPDNGNGNGGNGNGNSNGNGGNGNGRSSEHTHSTHSPHP